MTIIRIAYTVTLIAKNTVLNVKYIEANLHQVGLATYAVWKESFLFRIPDSLSDAEAAPLMCAGSTVYNVLWKVTQGSRIDIVGVGGLSHLATQFARKGFDVTVFSRGEAKKEESLQLGADTFYTNASKQELTVERKIDSPLVTTSVQPGNLAPFY